jgi:hypothetical protein
MQGLRQERRRRPAELQLERQGTGRRHGISGGPGSILALKSSARKIVEIANAAEVVQDGRIYIEKINGPFLFKEGGSPAEYGAGLELAIAKGWLWRHESGTYVKFTQAGAELFA